MNIQSYIRCPECMAIKKIGIPVAKYTRQGDKIHLEFTAIGYNWDHKCDDTTKAAKNKELFDKLMNEVTE